MADKRILRIVEITAAGAIMASAALVAVADVPSVDQWIGAAFFTAFGVLASVLVYSRTAGASGTIGFLPFLSAALIAPNGAALATVFTSILISEILARREPLKLIFNLSQYMLAQACAIAAYLGLGGVSLLDSRPPAVAFFALFIVFTATNKLAVTTVIAAPGRGAVRANWFKGLRDSAVYDLLSLPLIVFFALVYREYGPQGSAILALPLLGIRQLYKTNFALQKVNEELLQLMVASIEARDPYTSGHSQRVARYARVIARAAGLSNRATERTVIAALLHDVGKIHEEFATILRKPGALTDEEFAVMKTHPARSAELVQKVSQFADLVPAVLAHHEAWDGCGYPARLKGDQIPMGARIIALADTIDAMTTSRPYRASLTLSEVHRELHKQAGRQFDPRIGVGLLEQLRWAELTREIAAANAEHPASNFWAGSGIEGRAGEYSMRVVG